MLRNYQEGFWRKWTASFSYLRGFLSLLTVSVEKDEAATIATLHMTSCDPLPLARVSSTPKGNDSVSLQHKSKQTLHTAGLFQSLS